MPRPGRTDGYDIKDGCELLIGGRDPSPCLWRSRLWCRRSQRGQPGSLMRSMPRPLIGPLRPGIRCSPMNESKRSGHAGGKATRHASTWGTAGSAPAACTMRTPERLVIALVGHRRWRVGRRAGPLRLTHTRMRGRRGRGGRGHGGSGAAPVWLPCPRMRGNPFVRTGVGAHAGSD